MSNSKKTKPPTKFRRILLIVALLALSPLVVFALEFVFVMYEQLVFEWTTTQDFDQEIRPKVMPHVTDPNVEFEQYPSEHAVMPQFYIHYAPNVKITFHNVVFSGKDIIQEKHPLLEVYVDNKACGFKFRDKNYDFLRDKPSLVSDKLIELYNNRNLIIEDFVADQPECFV